MDIDQKIFKAYDIRGIYPTELNEQNIARITQAIYAFFVEKIQKDGQLTVVLSYDMRLSGPQLYASVKHALVEMGAHVIDIGMTSTPTFYFAVSHYGYDCGIQVTASHNPKEWNGMKFVINTPQGLLKIGKSTGMDEIKQHALDGTVFAGQPGGTVESKEGVLMDEVMNALQLLGNPQINPFTVVADPANAMGATYIAALFDKIPGTLIKMNFDLDGSFPAHQPDPLNFDNLKDLQARVVAEHADFGIAPDGDGDRLYFVDETGAIVAATQITELLAREFLQEKPGSTILFDVRYILGSQKIVHEYGGISEVTKVGHAFITEALSRTGGIFAGESSGHFYYQATGNAESQVITILAVMKILSKTGKPLSQIIHEVQRSYESGEYNFHVTNAPEILEALQQTYADAQIDTLDGISLNYPTWRCNVRISNTEPLMRLNVEAYDKQVMEEKYAEIKAFISAHAT